MTISEKPGAIVFVAVLVIGVLGVLYSASRVIIFTNKFSTYVEISRGERKVSIDDIYATLNRMVEISTYPGDCPNRLGDCRSVDGNITVSDKLSSQGAIKFRISTEELTGIWWPTPSPARHEGFVDRVTEAFRGEGYFVEVLVN